MKKTDRLGGRSISDTAPPTSGKLIHLGSILPLESSVGKMRVICQHCETTFFRFASHVRRREKNYCSVACRHAGMKIEVHTNCIVCNADMVQTPSLAAKVITCSKECSSKRKRGGTLSRGWPEYKESVKQIAETSVCSCCGKTNGPWVVRGLLSDSKGKASLWCRNCHIKDLQQKVAANKVAKPESLEKAIRMLEKHGFSVKGKP